MPRYRCSLRLDASILQVIVGGIHFRYESQSIGDGKVVVQSECVAVNGRQADKRRIQR